MREEYSIEETYDPAGQTGTCQDKCSPEKILF